MDQSEGELANEIAAALLELDEWENKWFPILLAMLSARYVAVAARVFLNLGQAQGTEVIVTVQTLLDWMSALAGAVAGSEEAAAHALLALVVHPPCAILSPAIM